MELDRLTVSLLFPFIAFSKKDPATDNVFRYSQLWATFRYTFPYWSHWNIAYTKQGKRKLAITRALRVLATGILIFSLISARRRGITFADFRNILRYSIMEMLHRVEKALRSARNAIKL